MLVMAMNQVTLIAENADGKTLTMLNDGCKRTVADFPHVRI